MADGKHIVICPKCRKERQVSMRMVYFIQNNKYIGQCKSCALKGNKNKLGYKPSKETKKKMSLAKVGKKKSEETRKRMSEAHKGYIFTEEHLKNLSKSHLRYGDKPVERQERNDSAYWNWAMTIKRRDNWKCKISNEDCRGKVVAHHILPWKDYPELRYKVNNGITLCQAHHPKVRAEEKRLIPFFQGLVPVSNRLIWQTEK